MENSRFWDEMAIQSFKTILQQNPNQPKIHTHLGLAYMRVNKVNKAIQSFLRAIKCDKNCMEAYYHLGTAYQKLEKNVEAIRCFKNYTKLAQKHKKEDPYVVDELLRELELADKSK